MLCGHCDFRMIERDVEGVTLDVCARCGATWFDAGELGAHPDAPPALEERLRERALEQPSGRNSCPRCMEATHPVPLEVGEAQHCAGCSGTLLTAASMAGLAGLQPAVVMAAVQPTPTDGLELGAEAVDFASEVGGEVMLEVGVELAFRSLDVAAGADAVGSGVLETAFGAGELLFDAGGAVLSAGASVIGGLFELLSEAL